MATPGSELGTAAACVHLRLVPLPFARRWVPETILLTVGPRDNTPPCSWSPTPSLLRSPTFLPAPGAQPKKPFLPQDAGLDRGFFRRFFGNLLRARLTKGRFHGNLKGKFLIGEVRSHPSGPCKSRISRAFGRKLLSLGMASSIKGPLSGLPESSTGYRW
jgi:hypothetical protein